MQMKKTNYPLFLDGIKRLTYVILVISGEKKKPFKSNRTFEGFQWIKEVIFYERC